MKKHLSNAGNDRDSTLYNIAQLYIDCCTRR